MRCKACNREDANPVYDDWYCTTCTTIIRRATGEDYTLADLYDTMEEQTDAVLIEEILKGTG